MLSKAKEFRSYHSKEIDSYESFRDFFNTKVKLNQKFKVDLHGAIGVMEQNVKIKLDKI